MWMFDRAACTPMRIEPGPQVDIAALQTLRVLLTEVAGVGTGAGLASSNAPMMVTKTVPASHGPLPDSRRERSQAID